MKDRKDISAFVSGTHNLLSDELIPRDAASESLGWLTTDGRIELMYGRQPQGNAGAAGRVIAMHTARKTDGTTVFFRKIWDGSDGKVQYLDSGTWTNIITGLPNTEITFSNYSSLAGNFVYLGGPEDGLFKIVTANPGSYSDLYDATKNFKGYFFIDRARSIMWGTKDDSTGLYGSYIDAQDSDVYTTVAAEAIGSSGSTNYTGTLAFRAGGSTRTCFGVVFTDGTQSITIGYAGEATADSDGTGTLNFTTGVYDVTFSATTTGAVTAEYQWEDSNANGVTDFSKSATRLAGEGFIVRQDKGGDAIQVVVPHDGSYFSFKENSVYKFTLDAEDINPVNELIRSDVGVKTPRSAVATSAGIMYMDTGNPSEPRISILQRNPVGDNFVTTEVFPQFKFENYNYDDVVIEAWDSYVLVACRESSDYNNRILLCNAREKTVDVAPYSARCFCKDKGMLYAGDPLAQTSYEMFTGFDDYGFKVDNFWESMNDAYGYAGLKKVKRFRFRGQISPDQSISIYVATDNDDYRLVGTILGSGDYVDYNTTQSLGTSFIGEEIIGGGNEISVYPFLMELKVKLGKFRVRKVKLVANGIGYCSLQQLTDHDLWQYEDRIPKKYRIKQNVSLDGATVNEDTPSY